MTISDVKTRVEQKLGALSDISNARWIAMAQDLNELLYQEMINVDPSRFITTQSYTVSTDPQTSALPAAFQDAQVWGGGFIEVDSDGKEIWALKVTGYGSSVKGYYIEGSNVVFTGMDNANLIRLRYVPTITALSSMSDSFIVPDRYKELVTQGIIKTYYEEYEDPRQYDADAKFARLLDQFLSSLPRTSRVYSLNPYYGV